MPPVRVQQPPHPLRRLVTRYGWIALMVLLVSFLHYNTAIHIHAAHGIYRRLYYFPIIIAAFRGGRLAGLITAVAVCLMYIPHAFGFIGFDPAPTLEKVLEMILYLAVGLVTGLLADRERRVSRRLQHSLAERERLEGELVQRERLAAVGRLSAGLAHEIRNPLASIKGAADMLKTEGDPASPRARMLAIIREESQRLNEVLTRFLAFARPGSGPRSGMDMRDEARRLADLLRQRDDAPRLCLSLPDSPVLVSADREQVGQLLLNLGLNALAAAGTAGRVDLELDRRDQLAVFQITDSGPGFSDEALANLGTPFFTTREGGTGLGLATCVKIAAEHGGTLVASNTDQGGARVLVSIPLAEVS